MKAMRRLSKQCCALGALVFFAIAGNADASLIGDEVTFAYVPQSTQGTTGIVGVDTFTAGTFAGHSFVAEIGANSIRLLGGRFRPPALIIGFGNASRHVLSFTSLDWLDDPTGILVGATLVDTNVPRLTQEDFTVGDHQLDILLALTEWNPNSFVEIELITDHTVVGLPAPMSLALFAIGLGGLGAVMRRRVV